MKQITLFFAVQFLRRLSGVYVLNNPQGDDGWYSIQRKDTKWENPKKYLRMWNTLYQLSKYQLIKSMYKIITSMFLKKSLEADRNSGIHLN